jgi:hypothetical protein
MNTRRTTRFLAAVLSLALLGPCVSCFYPDPYWREPGWHEHPYHHRYYGPRDRW